MKTVQVELLDQPQAGWFILDVVRQHGENAHCRDWAALMIDVDPGDLRYCTCDFRALFYVHPNDYHGKPLGEYFKVSVWDLDKALESVDCSVTNRLAFKSSLDRAGLLSVPK
jgi:hypothetical protein